MIRRRLRRLRVAAGVVVALATTTPAATTKAFVWPNVPEQVAAALDSDDPVERRAAVRRLPELPTSTATALAQKALADTDTEVRIAAASVAASLRIPMASELVIPWLNESDARLRLAACALVRAAPTDRAVSALGRVLGDADASVRVAAAAAMGASGSSEAVSPLLGHLDDPSPEARAEVARALGRLGDLRAVLPLVGKVQDAVPEVRRAVARALGELGDPRAAAALSVILADTTPAVRSEALDALGRLRSDEATLGIAALLDGLADVDATQSAFVPGAPRPDAANATLRRTALRALGRIGSPRAIDTLIAALPKDDPNDERSPVRDALVAAGPGAGPPLITLLSGSPSPVAAAGAALTLGDLHAVPAQPAVVRAMERGILPLRFGLRALGAMGSDTALPWVLERVTDADPLVRREAIRAASKLVDPAHPDGRPVDPARLAVEASDAPLDERLALVELLGRTGSASAQGVLLPLASRPPLSLRIAAIEALGTLGQPSAAVDAVLLDATADDRPPVRLAAALALARSGSGAALPRLLDRLQNAAEQDRGALGMAIAGALRRGDRGVIASVARALGTAAEPVRDALIEGLGRSPHREAGALLRSLVAGGLDDRRKVAEALAGHPAEAQTLVQLAADADSLVRANAAWSLGALPPAIAEAPLIRLASDVDIAVAGNAIGALGRLPTRGASSVTAICAALGDERAYVRANAVTTMGLGAVTCPNAHVRERLLDDPSAAVRLAAAAVLSSRATKDDADRRALARCTAEDRDGSVATRCASPRLAANTSHDLTLLVVPDGRVEPMAHAPFALERADGLIRMGAADRRGAVFERETPDGALRLLVPGPLAR